FINLFYTNNNPKSQLAPTPATGLVIQDPNFVNGGTSTANTFLLDDNAACAGVSPTSVQGILCSRVNLGGSVTPGSALDFAVFRKRMTPVGARQETFTVDQFQFLSGLQGDLGDGWSYETYINFSRNHTTDSVFNDVFKDRMTDSLKNCVVDVALFGAGCHSIDYFGKGDMTAADAAYIRIPVMTDITEIERTVFSASVTGSPFSVPAGEVQTAFGFEYREDSIDLRPDQVKQAGNILGFNRAGAVSGSYDASEVFAEVEIPLVKDVPLVHELTTNLAYRLSDYSSVGETDTYHVDLSWMPIESMRFRGSYQRADRAPDLLELFENGDQGFPPYTDPCRGSPAGALLAQCSATYLAWTSTPFTAPFTQTNSQVDTAFFGNSSLKDEKTDTYTIGLVFQPSAWKNFKASVDWYNISVNGAITREYGGTQNKINQCFLNTVGTGGACSGISRTASGDLVVTHIQFANLGSLETSGVDMQIDAKFNADDFGLDPSWGSVNLRVAGTWVDYYDISGGDVVGTITETGSVPEYVATAGIAYAVDDWRFYWSWRYVDHMVQLVPVDIKSKQYNDIAAEWNVSDHVQFYGGVNNVFDEQPGLLLGGNSNTDSGRYDIIGRAYFLGATIRY
ncbi:MAG: TonB-dependent receptor, partial [Alphaproteobacteria bacterium]|nr:TonB-dependent receptor [Alphaproteobacteria bacterium]